MRRWVAVAAAGAFLAPAPAGAATLTATGGVLEYSADSGRRNVVAFEETAPGTVRVVRQLSAGGDEDAFTTVQGCTPIGVAVSYSCPGITRVVANGGDGDDRLDAGSVIAGGSLETISATLRGGPGADALGAGDQADVLEGGDGDDSLTGGVGESALRGDGGNDLVYGGAGRELLDGGAGNDTLQGNDGADDLRGGEGVDTAFYGEAFGQELTVTLDGAAGDGKPGEGDVIEGDVENAVAGSETPGGGPGVVRVTGNDGANVLEVTKGNSTLVGGGGTDVLTGGPHADAIDARDGLADRIVCKAGADTVQADAVDDVAGDCEAVTRVAAPVTPTPTPGPRHAARRASPTCARSRPSSSLARRCAARRSGGWRRSARSRACAPARRSRCAA